MTSYHAKVGMRKASRIRTIEALRASYHNAVAAGDHVLAGLLRSQLYTVEHGYWPPTKYRYDQGGVWPTGKAEAVLTATQSAVYTKAFGDSDEDGAE